MAFDAISLIEAAGVGFGSMVGGYFAGKKGSAKGAESLNGAGTAIHDIHRELGEHIVTTTRGFEDMRTNNNAMILQLKDAANRNYEEIRATVGEVSDRTARIEGYLSAPLSKRPAARRKLQP